MSYPDGTIGWLKYQHSNIWHRVAVHLRLGRSHVYVVEKSSTRFTVGSRDVLIVVGA